MEHEVLPCYTDRTALTFWISADYSNKSPSHSLALPASLNPPYKISVGNTIDCSNSSIMGSNLSSTPQPQHQRQSKSNIRKPLNIPTNILPFSLDSDHWNKKTVFVSIASYCDSECGITIQDLFQHASYPERIFVGVAWQGEMKGEWDWVKKDSPGVHFISSSRPSSDIDGNNTRNGGNSTGGDESSNYDNQSKEESWRKYLKANTRVAAIPLGQATGPCWARGVAFSLWRNEHYLLQIDSHMRFRSGWDSYLIWQLEMTREDMISSHQDQMDTKEAMKKKNEGGEEDEIQHNRYEQIDGTIKHSEHGHGHGHGHGHVQWRMKPVLTTYPLGYLLPNCIPDDTRPTLLVNFISAYHYKMTISH